MATQSTRHELAYRPPFDWAFFLRYLGARRTAGVECVTPVGYRRTLEIEGATGTMSVGHDSAKAKLILTIRGDVGQHAPLVVESVRRLFDLEADLSRVHAALEDVPLLAPLLADYPGIRIPGCWSPFELLVRTIVGQQVTVKAATTLIGRILERLGTPFDGATEGGPGLLFPAAETIASANLQTIGMPGKRVQTLQHAARAVAEGRLRFDGGHGDTSHIRERLLDIPGIGPWTVEYFALRALGDSDAWPESDLVLRRAIERQSPNPTRAERFAETWRPYRGYAAMHLWNQAAITPARL